MKLKLFNQERDMTNREFAVKDSCFKECCLKVGIEPTSRQAGKFRRKKGLAYQYHTRLKGCIIK